MLLEVAYGGSVERCQRNDILEIVRYLIELKNGRGVLTILTIWVTGVYGLLVSCLKISTVSVGADGAGYQGADVVFRKLKT
jgi:hypothetical protein